jgi:hypothetical protein
MRIGSSARETNLVIALDDVQIDSIESKREKDTATDFEDEGTRPIHFAAYHGN